MVRLRFRIISVLLPGLPVAVAGKLSVAGTLRTPPVGVGVGVGEGVAVGVAVGVGGFGVGEALGLSRMFTALAKTAKSTVPHPVA